MEKMDRRDMNMKKLPVAVFVFIVFLAFVSVLLFCFFPPFTTKIKHKAYGIGEKVFVEIGGVTQGMIIKGNNLRNPVLLFLSCGPGIPEYFLEYKYPSFLADEFVVCFWDWRGTGLSYSESVPPESMTRSRFLEDTFEVTEYLRSRFGRNKIFLAAHSFGTSVGIQAAAEHPELYNAYIAVSQIADQASSEKIAYEYMVSFCEKTGKKRLLRRLKDNPLGNESYFSSGTRDKAMHSLGIGTARKMKSVVTGIFFPSLRMTDYSMNERLNIWRGKSFVNRTMENLFSFSSFETVKSVDIPVCFLAGKYDFTCSYELQKEYFEFLESPEKFFCPFENSAHSPIFEEPGKAAEIIRQIKARF